MRVITGRYRGRRLSTPKNKNIRPTSDKVKESIFNMIAPYVEEAVCLDLFSGTGNLGIEALSRGAKKCYFSDSSNESISLIKENIAICKAESHAVILAGDYSKNLLRVKEKVQIIIIDPPYKAGLYENSLEIINNTDLLDEDGIILLEHDKEYEAPEVCHGVYKIKEKSYGTIIVSIYKKIGEDHD